MTSKCKSNSYKINNYDTARCIRQHMLDLFLNSNDPSMNISLQNSYALRMTKSMKGVLPNQ